MSAVRFLRSDAAWPRTSMKKRLAAWLPAVRTPNYFSNTHADWAWISADLKTWSYSRRPGNIASFLDEAIQHYGWEIAAALVTIFIEGTKDERAVADPSIPKVPLPALEEHPLVKHYGMAIEHLALTKAHRQVEGNHRAAAWNAILSYVSPTRRGTVVRSMNEALDRWLSYRDEVAAMCGIERNG